MISVGELYTDVDMINLRDISELVEIDMKENLLQPEKALDGGMNFV